MKERFKRHNFKTGPLSVIHQAISIVEELSAKGYTLTLRQLFYQLVSRDIIQNTFRSYKNLGNWLNDARLAGLVDWDHIEDRTRNLQGVPHWDQPSSIIESAAASFRIDKWARQDRRIEVWVEKDALIGVIAQACRKLDVQWFSCRGYTSQSELYGAGKRLGHYIRNGQEPLVVHLGDHDPSGIDMSRDITERLEMFARGSVEVKRIALNMDQVEEFNPPPNYAKPTDSRYEDYRREFGEDCWELDALDPAYIDEIISDIVIENRDDDLWEEDVEREERHRTHLAKVSRNWSAVEEFLTTLD